MDAKRIKIIIAMMSIALIGVISLQAYWIRWNMRLIEQQFDKNVIAALNDVADKLQYYENAAVIEALNTSFNDQHEANRNIRKAAKFLENGYSMRANESETLSPGSEFEDNVNRWEYIKVRQLVDSKPLAERINLEQLARTLKQELNSRGIESLYQYGVYAKAKSSYVVVNDHYVVVDNSNPLIHGGASSLYNSPYRVALFQQDVESPGYLSIYFPNRTILVLSSVLTALALAVVFTSIILFCFYYTIRVIFQQKKLSEMKTDFINNMTHEFKTPIATISLAADSITSPLVVQNPDKINRFVDIIRQENRRMNSQVERVLQIALLDKKDFQLKLSPINLHELISQAIDNFSLQIDKREGSLTARLDAERPVIQGDATHIASIIHNLLDNANKYSPDKPEITVYTRNVPMGVEVTVEDKGIGISKEARKHIFDKFYRVHTGNIHDVKGFGLGLSYVKAIMTAHKGLADVRSEPGKGSSFILTFPFKVSDQ